MNSKTKKVIRKKRLAITLLKLVGFSLIILFTPTVNTIIMSKGFFISNQINSISIIETEPGKTLCIQNDLLYVSLINYTEGVGYSNIIQIIDVHQPESPIVTERYKLLGGEYLIDFKIVGNIAYMLTELAILSPYRGSVGLLNISDPANPIRLGGSELFSLTTYRVNFTDRMCVYNNYIYVSSNDLHVFDCYNSSLPVKVASYPSSFCDLHIKDDFLYLVSNGIKIFSLTNPVNPIFLGEVNSIKNDSVRSVVYDHYVINAFRDSGLEVYDCSDTYHPTICGNYDFPRWRLYLKGEIQDIAIINDRLFAGGSEINIFDLTKPQNLKWISWLSFENQNINQIIVTNNYLYLSDYNNINIYSYIENSLGRNIGIGFGITVIVIGASLIWIRRRKKLKIVQENESNK
ncbi:MAG: hypothetical protein FK734_02655 [Asgard group archaeon]|nr:hypothetical protein [Asgard group archaeon]